VYIGLFGFNCLYSGSVFRALQPHYSAICNCLPPYHCTVLLQANKLLIDNSSRFRTAVAKSRVISKVILLTLIASINSLL